MEITWLGTAAFRIRTRTAVFLIDPFVSRNPRARPVQPLTPANLSQAPQVFLSHGHFDHAGDLPFLQARNICCSRTLKAGLIQNGVPADRLILVDRDGWHWCRDGIKAQAFFSRHIRFDFPLAAARLRGLIPDLLPCFRLLRAWPRGRVLSWRFTLEEKTLHFFGTGGSTKPELKRIARKGPLDLLMVPLQGHSRIDRIALDYVRSLKPKAVIPHHFDDFFPPVSRLEDLSGFKQGLGLEFPEIQLIIPQMNQPIFF